MNDRPALESEIILDVETRVEELFARELCYIMQQLDPAPDDIPWGELSDSDREYYRSCAEWLISVATSEGIISPTTTV